tara:strand:- start:138 stop:371 length:234 start_codon:yes stop_codon:yes gene_type:complete
MTNKQNNSWAVQFNFKGQFNSSKVVKDKWQTERWFRLNNRESAEKYMADQEQWAKRVARFEYRIVPDYLEAFNGGGA